MSEAKLSVRDQLLTHRNRLTPAELVAAAEQIADHLLASREVALAATVAAYVSIGTEPGTGLLLDRLREAGKRVLLPCLLADNDLDWALYDGDLRRARFGILEPAGERLGVEAVAGADVVLVPGLAVDRTGLRLGRGGGSYDRALGRVPQGTFTCVLLHDGEVRDHVPSEPHDRPVTAAVTPGGGLVRFR
ncbi:5-formyltetrahydrofolate cyclo-ligase [Nocardioides sp. Bht2]|uniref:5-formyltetrahydrofolate cyclo-ligase n=1 Tax=Nocardioides sp. Bht2 TaxID=3392297 RepID=UPI0039B68885